MGVAREYVVGWGTLALINAGLAQGKGRSGANWFLLSLLFGPLATLAIVMLDRGDALAPVAPARAPLTPWVQVLAGSLVLAFLALVLISR